MKNFLKNKVTIASILIMVISSVLYHNNSFYHFFYTKINPPISEFVGKNILYGINRLVHRVDIIGKSKEFSNPLKEKDFIDLKIDKKEFKFLKKLLNNRPVKKKWVDVNLVINNIKTPAKLKYHGSSEAQYNGGKYSYTIEIENGHQDISFFKRFKLIKGEEADPTLISINQLANSMGLISAYGEMKILRINGEEVGDYYYVEDIKNNFLTREFNIDYYSIISQISDWSRKEFINGYGHNSDQDLKVIHIENKLDTLHPFALYRYQKMCKYINENNVDSLKEMIDIQYMAKYLTVACIFNDVHFMTGDNLKFLYDFKKSKFYPIFRAESGGLPIDVDFSVNYVNFDKFLFYSKGESYSNSQTAKFFKILLSDNDLRNRRNNELFKFVKSKDSLIKVINNIYDNNHIVMLHSGRSRRAFNFQKMQQIKILETTLDLANQYLNYSHIYSTYDVFTKDFEILSDAFSSIKIIKNDSVIASQLNGISLKNNLEFNYSYKKFKIKNFSEDDFIFINNVSSDTIKDHIFFNYMNSSFTIDSSLLK
tara:strand:- start:1271 stop:2887 length:1617 start_codon:yes stop_codon:yes gene_type:complete